MYHFSMCNDIVDIDLKVTHLEVRGGHVSLRFIHFVHFRVNRHLRNQDNQDNTQQLWQSITLTSEIHRDIIQGYLTLTPAPKE